MFRSRVKLELSTYLRRERIAAILTGLAIFAALALCRTPVVFSAIFGGAIALWLFIGPNFGYVLMKAVPQHDRERVFKGWVLHCGWLQMPLATMPAAGAALLIAARVVRPSVLDSTLIVPFLVAILGSTSSAMFGVAIMRDHDLKGLVPKLARAGVVVGFFSIIVGGVLAIAYSMIIWSLWYPR